REKLRGHQRAGGLLLPFQQRLELRALRRVEHGEDALAALVVEGVEQIRRVVRRGRAADRGQRVVVELRQQRLQLFVVQLEERARRLARLDQQRQDAI